MKEFTTIYNRSSATTFGSIVKSVQESHSESITGFEESERYDPDTAHVHPWTRGLTIRGGLELLDELKSSTFSYLFNRYERGLNAFGETISTGNIHLLVVPRWNVEEIL